MLRVPGEPPLFSAAHPLASVWTCLTGRRDTDAIFRRKRTLSREPVCAGTPESSLSRKSRIGT